MCAVTPPAELALPMQVQAVRRARRFLEDVACSAHHPSTSGEARLLATELVSNAVFHGAPPITLRVTCEGDAGITIAVSDASPGRPRLRRAASHTTSGRGLALVDLLGQEWGVDADESGKTVWVRLRG